MSKITDSTPDLHDTGTHVTVTQGQLLTLNWQIQAPTPVRPAEGLVSKLERHLHSAQVQSSLISNFPTVDFTLEPLDIGVETVKEEMSLVEAQDVIATPNIIDRSKGDVAASVSNTKTADIHQKKRKRHQTQSPKAWGHLADYFLDQWIESLGSATESAAIHQKKCKIHQTEQGHFVDYFLDQWIEHLGSPTAGSSTMQADTEQPQTSAKGLEFQGRFSS